MKTSSRFSLLIATAALTLLSACGGSTSEMTDDRSLTAAVMAAENAPVADCEAEGCNRPRLIDRVAEQYRADANEQQAQTPAIEPVQPDAAQPVQAQAITPVQAGAAQPATVTANVTTNSLPADNPDQVASVTPSAETAGQPQ